MILSGFEFNGTTIITLLCVTLGFLVLFIAYRQLLRYFGKGTPNKADYVVLYELEINPVVGVVEFYFTSDAEKSVSLNVLDENMEFVLEISSQMSHKGGNIIRYDSTKLKNGNYFYCLQTDNQKTMKKMRVANA